MGNKHIMVVSILIIGALVLGATLAWFTWSTASEQNTNVVVTVEGATISYEDGENITNNNLIPTSTKEQGISKEITISSTGTVYLDLNMTVVTLDEGLKDASFKYEIYNGDNLINGGNFASSNTNDVINLLDGVEITSTPVTYILYIWIDGTMNNPNTMYNQNFEFRLSANATDEEPLLTVKRLAEQIALTVNEGTPDFGQIATTDEGIYAAEDNYGTSYYFRGAAEKNYVYFANFYWRIIRINGDGTFRLIYDGTTAHPNGESSGDREIENSEYNYTYGDNTYIGYMMGLDNQCTSGSCPGTIYTTSYSEATANTYSSTIKTTIDNWYKENIEDKGYSDYVADVIYCNDRGYYSGKAYGQSTTYYNVRNRIHENKTPSLICSQQNDAFTVDDTTNGNGALTYPVGLITADEASMGGGLYDTNNTSYYLYNGKSFWTMSSYRFTSDYGGVLHIGSEGDLNNRYIDQGLGVRAVLSLKTSVGLSGSGTITDPYVVQS